MGISLEVLVPPLLLALVVTSTSGMTDTCTFSHFLQTPGAWERWMYNLSEAGALSPNTRVHYIHVHKGLMSARIDGSIPYLRECIRNMANQTFLVGYKMEGQNLTYSCMHFVKRSRAVITIWKSKESVREDPKLCFKLIKDDKPWVMYAANYYENCPVIGGFNMQLYDGVGQRKCHTLYETPRMEMGCSDEKTSTIDFNFRSCKISRLIYEMNSQSWQTRYCTGTWTDGPYTFTILTRKDLASYWCLRFPSNHGDSFDAFLFSDVVCETNDIISESKQYVRLALTRQVVTSLCEDASLSCQTERYPWTCDHSIGEMFCRKNCSSCEKPIVTSKCNFTNLTGEWETIGPQSVESIALGDSNITVTPLGVTHCIRQEIITHTSVKSTNLVRFQTNGCFPRLYCLNMKSISPSLSVFKMLRGPVWPEYDTLDSSVTCSDNRFEFDNRRFLYFVDDWSPLISPDKPTIPMDCTIPGWSYEFTAEFANKAEGHCTGRLYQPGCPEKEKKKIILQYTTCSNSSIKGEYSYICLGHIPIEETYGRYLLVKEDSGKFFCFYFNKDMLYMKMLPGDQCFESAKFVSRLVTLNLREEDIDPCRLSSSSSSYTLGISSAIEDTTSVTVAPYIEVNTTTRGSHLKEQPYRISMACRNSGVFLLNVVLICVSFL